MRLKRHSQIAIMLVAVVFFAGGCAAKRKGAPNPPGKIGPR